MKTKIALLLLAVLWLSGCGHTRTVDLRDSATPLRGVVRAGQSLDQNWNLDVWVGGKSKRPPSFVLLPRGSMEWEASSYRSFCLYAEAWRFDQNNRKVVLARTKKPERVIVSRYGDGNGYGWDIEVRAEDDDGLYIYQKSFPSRWSGIIQ